MYNTFHQDIIPCWWSQNTASGTGSYVMLSGAQAMSLMSWNAGQPCQLPAVQDGGLTAHQRAHTCCQCPRCAVGVPDVLSVSQMCHASPAVYKAAAAQPRPQQRSYTQRCGAMLIPVVGLWPQAVTSRGSQCPPSPCRLPARPARSRRPWPRCWNGRAARPRSALLARGARASGRARVSTRETCDIPPKHGAAAGTALSRYQQLEGRCHTWWHCLEKWACLDLEVIFTWPHDWGKEPGRNTTCMVNVSDALQVQTVLGSSARLWGSWVTGRGHFRISYSISLHVEKVSTGKLPLPVLWTALYPRYRMKRLSAVSQLGQRNQEISVTFE